MNLAIFLSFKESMGIMRKVGQDSRFIEYYLKPYSQNFEKIYVFSWANEIFEFPVKNIELIPNNKNINPYLYNLLMPFIHRQILKKCSVIRLMQFTSIIPAIISKLFFSNKIIATYGFPYFRSLKINGKKIFSYLWKILEKISINFVDKFIVTYRNNFDYLVGLGVNLKKIIILPNGVDISVFKPLITGISNNDKIRILFIGRFTREKNILNLSKALREVGNDKNIFFTLVGSGDLENNIVNLLENTEVNYKIIHSLPHNQLVPQYQNSDIFLLPSLTEGYPKVIIEAMACGLPCIIGAYPGHEQIITNGENGLVCGFTPKEIAEKINELIKNSKLRNKLSKNAREFVIKNNDIKKIVSNEIELIKSL